jgi:hypothetical protein
MKDVTTGVFDSPHLALKASNTLDNNGFVGMTFATSTSPNYGYSLGALRSTNGGGDLVIRRHNNDVIGTEVARLSSIGELQLNGHNVYHTGNFNPANYLPLAGGTLTGDLSIRTGNTDKYITFDYSGNNTYN